MKNISAKSYQGQLFNFTLFSISAQEQNSSRLIRITFETSVNAQDLSFFSRYFKEYEFTIHTDAQGFLDFCAVEIYEFMCGKRTSFTLPVLTCGTNFQCAVFDDVKKIAYGEVKNFDEIGLDIKKGSTALLSNPLPLIIPCHRLNARKGETTAYVGGISLKRKLLNLEYETKTGGNAIKSANEYHFDYSAYEALIPRNIDLDSLETYAKLHNIPITKPESMALIKTLCLTKAPQFALEIGTAIGYSAISIAPLVSEKLITLERDAERGALAKANFSQYGIQNVDLIVGEALEELEKLSVKLDFVYIDAAKGQNRAFFEKLQPLLNQNAVLVFDNCIYKGLVLQEEHTQHKSRTMVKKLGEFIVFALNHPDYQSALIPIGDGLLTMVLKC